jgi:hypothetical protein
MKPTASKAPPATRTPKAASCASARGVVREIAGAQETFAVASSRLSRRLRAGETVRFDWETRDGRLVITNIR